MVSPRIEVKQALLVHKTVASVYGKFTKFLAKQLQKEGQTRKHYIRIIMQRPGRCIAIRLEHF